MKCGRGGVYLPEYGVNTIGMLAPGQGYKAYLSRASTLIYSGQPQAQGAGTAATARTTTAYLSSHGLVSQEASVGPDATLLVLAPGSMEEVRLSVETERGTVVGQGVVRQGQALISVEGDDDMTPDVTEGALPDEALFLKAASADGGAKSSLQIVSVKDAITGSVEGQGVRYQTDAMLIVGIDEIPSDFKLDQNYPNPFSAVTTIRYGLPSDAPVRIEVFNVLGQRVAVLVDEVQEAGNHEAVFHSRGLASGLYFCKLEAGGFRSMRQMMLVD